MTAAFPSEGREDGTRGKYCGGKREGLFRFNNFLLSFSGQQEGVEP